MSQLEFKSNIEKAQYIFESFKELNENDPEVLKMVLQQGSGIKLDAFNLLYDKFVEMHKDPEEFKGVKAKTRGDILEELIRIVTIETNIFSLYSNVTNDTNEYDIIIEPSELSKQMYNAIPEIVYQPIICECKNYQDTIGVTWIGKLYMLLSITNIKVGIIFSYEGITGEKDWEDSKGLVKKIFLKDGIAILDIGIKELEKIKNGERFYDVVQKKYNELVYLTEELENSKITHASAEKVEEILEKVKLEVEYYKSKQHKKKSKQ